MRAKKRGTLTVLRKEKKREWRAHVLFPQNRGSDTFLRIENWASCRFDGFRAVGKLFHKKPKAPENNCFSTTVATFHLLVKDLQSQSCTISNIKSCSSSWFQRSGAHFPHTLKGGGSRCLLFAFVFGKPLPQHGSTPPTWRQIRQTR